MDKFIFYLSKRYEYLTGVNAHSEMALHVDTYKEADTQYKNAIDHGATSLLEPTTEPWGQRTCFIADPEGNVIEIGSWNKPYERGKGFIMLQKRSGYPLLSLLISNSYFVDSFKTTSYGSNVRSFTSLPSTKSKSVRQATIPSSFALKLNDVIDGTLFSKIVLL